MGLVELKAKKGTRKIFGGERSLDRKKDIREFEW
jgi:hypothetical protein